MYYTVYLLQMHYNIIYYQKPLNMNLKLLLTQNTVSIKILKERFLFKILLFTIFVLINFSFQCHTSFS